MEDSPIKQLDVLLSLFFKNKQFHSFRDISRLEELKEIAQSDIPLILDKLIDDGYVKEYQNAFQGGVDIERWSSYNITFYGKLFFKSGGYEEKERVDKININKIESDLILRKRNDHRLVIGTFVVGIGALALVAWELIKYFFLECR